MSSMEVTLPRDDERTPEDWLAWLTPLLTLQAMEAQLYEAYYNGQHPLQFATSKFREAFGTLFGAFADNWCQIVVDAAVERLRITGFRAEGGDTLSDAAWSIWQENGLDAESVIAHTEAGKSGHAFLLVDPNDGEPLITVEHATQVVVARDPANRRNRLAALKRWKGDDGFGYATLYLPDVVLRFESTERLDAPSTLTGGLQWTGRTTDAAEVANPLGVVPVIPLENKPSLIPPFGKVTIAHSDLEPAVPLQNAVNKLCTDLIVASEYGAFPQRVVTGVEVPKDPDTGQPLAAAELKAAMSRLWTFKPADARVTALPATDLSNFVTAIEMFVTHLAAQTRTPPHYLLAKLVNMSGDALSVAEAGLVSKCRAKTLSFSDPWEEAIGLALQAAGEDATAADVEAIWANPERVQLGALVDAAVKKKTLGIPLPVIWLELGYTPEQIAEMVKEEESAQEAALQAAAAAEAAVAREQLAGTPTDVATATREGEPAPAPPPAPAAPARPPTGPPPTS
jgi:hypothetical protein